MRRRLIAAVFSLAFMGGPASAQDDVLARIDEALPEIVLSEGTSLRLGLDDWMAALAVPGLSLAIINDYAVSHRLTLGVQDTTTEAPVTPDTVFQAASVAKPVAAMGALRMVQEGRLDLDAPIESHLGGWTLPRSDAVQDAPVTLRDLLAHSAGVTPGGFRGYGPDDEIPGILAILDGAPPAHNPPAQIVTSPGEAVAYSGLGYTVVQWAMQHEADQDFDGLMRDLVFAPLGMNASSFSLDPPPAWANRTASGHRASGAPLPGGWMRQPEAAAAGLWTTADDLAILLIETAQAVRGQSDRVLSRDAAAEMLTTHRDHMGLGWISAADAPHGLFSHSGGNTGFAAHVRMMADSGDGLVLMMNGDGAALTGPLIGAVEAAWGWPDVPPRSLALPVWLSLVDHVHGPERAIVEYMGVHADSEAASPLDLILWGYGLIERERGEDALAAFAASVRLHPDDPYVFIHQARAQERLGRSDLARTSLTQALALEPDNALAGEMIEALDETSPES